VEVTAAVARIGGEEDTTAMTEAAIATAGHRGAKSPRLVLAIDPVPVFPA